MESPTTSTNIAIDLSLRTVASPKLSKSVSIVKDNQIPVVIRPIPRPPWTIMWYQSLWAQNKGHQEPVSLNISSTPIHSPSKNVLRKSWPKIDSSHSIFETRNSGSETESQQGCTNRNESPHCHYSSSGLEKFNSLHDSQRTPGTVVLDIACCDGPVMFERVSNPNFALTVEHNDESSPMDESDLATKESQRHLSLKTYVCIYCNQSFKSLFCYQKHKKRHLNPVSVDITATQATHNRCASDSKTKTKDLNVQFFPCKKCGCKFPSYYFVHKHRKVCH